MPLNTTLSIIPRIPNNRPIDYISQKELMEGMFIVADKSFTSTKENLFNKTGRLFGFKNIGDKLYKNLDDVFRELLDTGCIVLENEIVKTNSFKIYKDNIHELKRVYENKEKNILDMIGSYFSSEKEMYDKFIAEFNRLSEAILKEIDSALNFIYMAPGHIRKVVDEIEERINVINH
ncbi:MAG: Pseudogene of conserved hypothetical protein [Methanobrevibacter sp. CfCl-M3]